MSNMDFPRVTLGLSIVLLQCCASAFCAPHVEWITGLGTEDEDHVFEGVHIKGGGFCVLESPKGGRSKSDGQFFPNKKNNIAQAMEPNNGGRTQYLQSYWVVIHAINGMKVN